MAKQRRYGTRVIKEKENTECCFYCGKKMKKISKTIDHINPIKSGGSNCYSNLLVCCKRCNSIKGGYTIWQLIEQLQKRYRFADKLERVKLDKQIEQWEKVKDRLKEGGAE